jgi:DNA-directed RNA polymerase specialized sigma subunit
MTRKKATKKRVEVNPIDEALQSSSKLAAQRREEDHQLWEQWKANPTEQTMHPLIKRFEPVFRQKVQQYKAPNVNTTGFKTQLKVRAVEAFQTYDPSRGASLRTHVENNLKRSMRYNAQHQNMAYIPEGQTAFIGSIDRATDALQDQLGRDPSYPEVAQFINSTPELLGGKKPMTPSLVQRIQSSRRKDVMASSMESDPTGFGADRNRAVLGLLRPELTMEQQQVFDHIYGVNGAPQINSTSALAKRLGKSQSQISRLKSGIADKYKKFI